MRESTERKPLIVVSDVETTGAVARALRRRYTADYDVVEAAGDASAALDPFGEAGRSVALVLADGVASSEEIFAHAGRMFPDARRALLLGWGSWADPETARHVLALMADLQIDYYVVRPHTPGDEDFHRTVTEFLREWQATANGRRAFTLIGTEVAPRTHALRARLLRGGVGVTRLDPDSEGAAGIVGASSIAPADAPVVRTPGGDLLVDPDDGEVARALGLSTSLPSHAVDVTIVGAGPAGLAAAVYAASEGLSTLVVESGAVGGQAGSSSLIRNYLGFPRGVAGAELAARAYQQAWAFGASFAHARTVTAVATGDAFALTIEPSAERVVSGSVIAATGVAYRRLAVPALHAFVGASVFYGASSAEAQAQRGKDVCVVGGGNSAGQAALHLARYAASVTLVVRGAVLAASMSRYLVEQLEALGVEILTETRVVDAVADDGGRLALVELENTATRERHRRSCRALFITIGARPHTDWLPVTVRRDRWGYVVTGSSPADDDQPDLWRGRDVPGALETSVEGLFAVGDTRRGSLKRVASAVGEGSVVVSAVHRFLATR